MSRFVVLAAALLAAAVVGGSAGASSSNDYEPPVSGGAAPAKPKPCATAPVRGARGTVKEGTVYPDELCGTRGDDKLTAVGGGDKVYGYQGKDEIHARNGKPDRIWGGPGSDTGDFDECDNPQDVETKNVATEKCTGIKDSQRRLAGADAPLPHTAPVIECYRGVGGERVVWFLREPGARAIDTTDRVDFQTVAWSAYVLRLEGTEWKVVASSNWYWDDPYDEQVEAFPGNFWRKFTDNERVFIWFDLPEPGIYRTAVRYHWYATEDAPERDLAVWARAHYGPAAQEDDSACVFPD